jgi:hypothetical protein
MSDDARLERIEKKLDQVGDAIVALARMEERMITILGAGSRSLREKLATMDKHCVSRSASSGLPLRAALRRRSVI